MSLQRSDFDIPNFNPIGAGWIPITRRHEFDILGHRVVTRIAYSGDLAIYQEFNREKFPKLYSRSGGPLFRSVLAVAALVDGGPAFYGLSFCSLKENFSLRRGVQVAFARLVSYMIEGQPGGAKLCSHESCMKKRADIAGRLGRNLFFMAQEALISGVWIKESREVCRRISS